MQASLQPAGVRMRAGSRTLRRSSRGICPDDDPLAFMARSHAARLLTAI